MLPANSNLDGWSRSSSVGVYVGLVEMGSLGCFAIELFRSLVETKSEAEDVALFKHHLNQPQPVDA